MANHTHSFTFFRAGGVEQVLLRSGADLMNLAQLDQKLWVALACPVKGLELDPRTLELIDADKDGRIRAPEFLAAIKWVGEVLKNPDDLFKGGDSVALAAIKDEALRAGAQRILDNLGKGQSAAISLADVADTARIFAGTRLNGDGVVPAEAAGDAELQKVLEDIIATHGSAADRSGKPGVNQALAEAFFKDVGAVYDWHKKAEAGLLPLGEGTAAAAAAVAAVKVKVEDYFARCRLAAFDPRAAAKLNRDEGEYAALATKDLTAAAEDIAKLPLHRIEAGRPLPMSDGLNPAWAGAVALLAAAPPLRLHPPELRDWNTHFQQACAIMRE